jgi:hypothetical protein
MRGLFLLEDHLEPVGRKEKDERRFDLIILMASQKGMSADITQKPR